MSEVPQGRPAFPGILGRCPRPKGSTSCPGGLGPMSEVPRCRPAVREIRARVLVPMGSTAVTDDSCPGPRDCGFDPLCWTSRAWVRVLAVSTSCPGQLAPWSEAVRDRPEILGDSGPCPSTRGVDQLSWVTRARVRNPAGSTCFPGHFGRCPWPAGSIRCPWRHDPMSKVPRGRPAVLDDSRLCPSSQGVHQLSRTTPIQSESPRCHQLSWATRARIRGPAWSTTSPG